MICPRCRKECTLFVDCQPREPDVVVHVCQYCGWRDGE
jgi:hypothetical protein